MRFIKTETGLTNLKTNGNTSISNQRLGNQLLNSLVNENSNDSLVKYITSQKVKK